MELELSAQVEQAIAAGRKIEAIKLLREEAGLDLKEAKELVDARVSAHRSFEAQHPAGPRNDTGVGRLVLILAVLAAVVVAYLFLQT